MSIPAPGTVSPLEAAIVSAERAYVEHAVSVDAFHELLQRVVRACDPPFGEKNAAALRLIENLLAVVEAQPCDASVRLCLTAIRHALR
jgi:hypothetical protein